MAVSPVCAMIVVDFDSNFLSFLSLAQMTQENTLHPERIKSIIGVQEFRHELACLGVKTVTLWHFICIKTGHVVLVEVQNHG